MKSKMYICPVGIFCSVSSRCGHSKPHKLYRWPEGDDCTQRGMCAPQGFKYKDAICIPTDAKGIYIECVQLNDQEE